jgi:hypothetical protein
VYALLDERMRAPRRSGLAIIGVGGVFAAVREAAGAPALSEAALREQHRIVVLLARTARAILPVRFGTLVDRERLEHAVSAGSAALGDAFRMVRDREQMTVRVFGVTSLRPSPAGVSSGTEYLLARAALARPALPPLAAAIARAVAPLVRSERIDPGQRDVQVTLHHLVDRGRAPEYRSIVDATVTRTAPSSSSVVSGPWPPFAFAPDLWSPDARADRRSS